MEGDSEYLPSSDPEKMVVLFCKNSSPLACISVLFIMLYIVFLFKFSIICPFYEMLFLEGESDLAFSMEFILDEVLPGPIVVGI